jgi:uncharacterized protein YdiU (UPF0061 family)
MTSLQEIIGTNFNVSLRLRLMGKRLDKSSKQSSKIAFLEELFFLFEAALCQYELRAIKAKTKKILKKLGITLQYPMLNLSAQCESIRKEVAPSLLNVLEQTVKTFSQVEYELRKMKTEAQEAKMLLFCRKLDKFLVEIDELITPLQDIKQVLSSICGPERTKIDSLNKKIRVILSA